MFVVCLVGDGEGEKEEGKGGGERRSCRRAEEEDAEDPKKIRNFQGSRPNGGARNLQLWRVLRKRNSQPLISKYHKQIMSLKTT